MLYLNILICVEYLSRKSCIWCSKGPPHLRTDGSRAPCWCWCWLYWPVDVEMQRNKAHRRLCILSEYILLSIGNVKWLTIYIAYCVNCSFLVPKENEMCSLTAASSFLQLRVWGCQCGNWFSNCCEQRANRPDLGTHWLLCSGWTLLRSSGLRLLGPHGKMYLRRSQQTLYI